MRPRVQVKYVTEHMKYLEEKIHVIKPVVEALQAAAEKSKTWLEGKSDNKSLTYCDLSQELESATLALLDVSSLILSENNDSVEDGKSFSSTSTSQKTATAKYGRRQSTDQILNETYKPSEILSQLEQIETVISSLQDVSRLEQIETSISSLQDANDKSTDDISEIKQWRDNFVTKQSDMGHNVMYNLLQQRLMPIDKLIQIFNQNLESREERIKKIENIENTISKLSKEVHLIESRVCNRYACHVQLANPTPVSDGSIISTFGKVREYNGQHFDQTTGTFISPDDGLYLVCVNLNEWGDKYIGVNVWAGGRCYKFIEVKYAGTSAAGSVVVDMKKGQELYFQVFRADQGANLYGHSSFTIVRL